MDEAAEHVFFGSATEVQTARFTKLKVENRILGIIHRSENLFYHYYILSLTTYRIVFRAAWAFLILFAPERVLGVCWPISKK
jgi:hypothetical protein